MSMDAFLKPGPVKARFHQAGQARRPFDALRLKGETLAFVRRDARHGWGETGRELVDSQDFRIDLFGRGRPRLTARQVSPRLRAKTIVPVPPGARETDEHAPKGAIFKPGVADRVAATLEKGAQSIGEAADGLDLDDRQGLQTVLLAIAARMAAVGRPAADLQSDRVRGVTDALSQR